MNVNELLRKNVRNMAPYSSARSLNSSSEMVLLDANENPFATRGRYPDPSQTALRKALANFYNVDCRNVLAGNGSDELIDLLMRAFTEPRQSNIIIPQPTYGMYEVLANIQNCNIRKVLLNVDFMLDADRILSVTDSSSRIIFICSPNNPSGNEFSVGEIEKVLKSFSGIVVLDQAYADFSSAQPWRNRISEFPNLVVLQTFSKAWGLASLRVGYMFANQDIVDVLMRIKMPYNLNSVTTGLVIEQLQKSYLVQSWIERICLERQLIVDALQNLSIVECVYPSDANFILVKFANSQLVFKRLQQRGIIVRNRSNELLCDNCLRISIGSPNENKLVLAVLKAFEIECLSNNNEEK